MMGKITVDFFSILFVLKYRGLVQDSIEKLVYMVVVLLSSIQRNAPRKVPHINNTDTRNPSDISKMKILSLVPGLSNLNIIKTRLMNSIPTVNKRTH